MHLQEKACLELLAQPEKIIPYAVNEERLKYKELNTLNLQKKLQFSLNGTIIHKLKLKHNVAKGAKKKTIIYLTK
jgi:hypothetical protein